MYMDCKGRWGNLSRDEFFENLFLRKFGVCVPTEVRPFILYKEGDIRIICTKANGEVLRLIMEKKVDETLVGEPIYKPLDLCEGYEKLKADQEMVAALLKLIIFGFTED